MKADGVVSSGCFTTFVLGLTSLRVVAAGCTSIQSFSGVVADLCPLRNHICITLMNRFNALRTAEIVRVT